MPLCGHGFDVESRSRCLCTTARFAHSVTVLVVIGTKIFLLKQGCTFYKQEDSVFFGKLLKGCDAEASGEYMQHVLTV